MKTLKTQRRLASDILKVGSKRIWFDNTKLDEIKSAITRLDIRRLIKDGVIKKKHEKGISKGRIRKNIKQRRKGRQKGKGSKQGKRTARLPLKEEWVNKIRTQRALLKILKKKSLIEQKDYKELRNKCKGGFFKSRKHLRLYIKEHNLIKENVKK